MKAVFIEKITRFVQWPENSNYKSNSDKIVISVIGENPFGEILDHIYSYQKIQEKEVQVKYITTVSQIEGSDILFISESQSENLESILEYVKDKPILTFGETRGYADRGVHVNFYLQNNKIRFEINETAARSSNFYISFRLLSHAKIVNPIN